VAVLSPEISMPFCGFISKYQTNRAREVLEQIKGLDEKGAVKMGVHTDAPGTSLSHTMVLHIKSVTNLYEKKECGRLTLAKGQTPIQPLPHSPSSTG